MESRFWPRLDRLSRYVHLYTGMFLIPWMAIYALSAFCLNHNKWIRERFGITPPRWESVREESFKPAGAFPREPGEQALAILERLDLAGPHFIQGRPVPNRMVILRMSGSGNYRVTWQRKAAKLTVEKQKPFSLYRLIHFLHFRGGYHHYGVASVIWAMVVDAVSVSMLLWIVTGVYLWARRPRKRLAGGLCAVAGSVLFIILTVVLCR